MKYELIKSTRQGYALILTAVATAAATFFMSGQEFTTTGGIIMVLSTPFAIFGFSGVFERFKHKMPVYSAWGFLLFLFGAVATVNFGMRGIMGEMFGLTISDLEIATQQFPLTFTLVFFAIGPAYPLSIIILGINLYRKKEANKIIAWLLIVAGILFPPSRISRQEMLMHIADLFLVIPLIVIGWEMIVNGRLKKISHLDEIPVNYDSRF